MNKPLNQQPQTNTELNDNEKKAEREREELARTNSEHTTDDHHKEIALDEQQAYEKGQREQRETEDNREGNTESR